jgi:hypothetical protein
MDNDVKHTRAAGRLLHTSAMLAVALQCGNADTNSAARSRHSLQVRQAVELSVHASHRAGHGHAERRHRKRSLQSSDKCNDIDGLRGQCLFTLQTG